MRKQDAWAKALEFRQKIDNLRGELEQLCRVEGLEFSQTWEVKSSPSWDYSDCYESSDHWDPSDC